VLTLDTSGFLALLNGDDPGHEPCRHVFDEDEGPYFISIAVLSEIAWFLENRFQVGSEKEFLRDLKDGAYTLDWDAADLGRIDALTERYRDLPLGLADAAVIACGVRHGGRVLTTDRRHFPVVARSEPITVVPDPFSW
jgi:predicted nucleic acid-binding protein